MKIETITFTGAPMSTNGAEITIMRMPLNKIKIGRNSRANIDKDELEGLMESIKSIGLLQPIGVVKNGSGYDIAYGNRRFLACSKLGHTHIAAIVHTVKKTSEIDIKNLAENVQRKNISLTEVGRYVTLLKGEGLSTGEIAIRLGASRSYVETCQKSYSNVPREFQKDIVEVGKGGQKTPSGKISSGVAMKVLNITRSYRLSRTQTDKLFEAARSNDRFEVGLLPKYAGNLKSGHDDFVEKEKPMKQIRVQFMITEKEYDEIQVKFVDNGIFNSVTEFTKAVLAGKKSYAFGIKG